MTARITLVWLALGAAASTGCAGDEGENEVPVAQLDETDLGLDNVDLDQNAPLLTSAPSEEDATEGCSLKDEETTRFPLPRIAMGGDSCGEVAFEFDQPLEAELVLEARFVEVLAQSGKDWGAESFRFERGTVGAESRASEVLGQFCSAATGNPFRAVFAQSVRLDDGSLIRTGDSTRVSLGGRALPATQELELDTYHPDASMDR